MNLQRTGWVFAAVIGLLSSVMPQAAQAKGKRPDTGATSSTPPPASHTPNPDGGYSIPKKDSPVDAHPNGTTTPSPSNTGMTGTNNIPTANGLPATSNPGGTMHE